MATIAILMDIQEGHILPSFGLGSALERRGHTVIYVSVPDNEDFVKAQGFRFFPIFESIYPRGFNQRYKRMGQLNENANKEHLAHIRLLMDGVLDPFMRLYKPDLFVISVFLKLETLILHYRYAIDPVIFIPYLPGNEDDLTKDCIDQIMHFPGDILYHLMEALKKAGIEFRSLEQFVRPLNLLTSVVACPEELDITRPGRRKNLHYLGPLIRLGSGGPPVTPQDGKKPEGRLIYASFGSQLPVYGDVVQDVLSRLIGIMEEQEMQDFRLIISAGIDKTFTGAIPSNVTILNWAPQIDILRVADLAIIHGGLGTIKECIYFGVPMLVIPQNRDQPANAKRVEEMGLGITGKIDRMDKDKLRSAILELAARDCIRTDLARMQKVFEYKQETEFGMEVFESLIPGGDKRGRNTQQAEYPFR